MTKQHRSLVFTCSYYSKENIIQIQQLFESKTARYIVYGKEIAWTTSTSHLQGFVIFNNVHLLKAVVKHLPSCHDIPHSDKSTNEQAADYCKKDSDFVELGCLNSQGKINDLLMIANKLDNGTTLAG